MAGEKSKWKRMLPYAFKYDVDARGFSPFEVFQEIIHKDRTRRVKIEDGDLDEMLDIVGLPTGETYSLGDRYKYFFNGRGNR